MKTLHMSWQELTLLNQALNDTRMAYKAMLPKAGFSAGVDDSPSEQASPSTELLLSMAANMQMVTLFDALEKDLDGVSFFDVVRGDAPCKLVAFSDVRYGGERDEDTTMTMTWDGAMNSSTHLLFLAMYQCHARQRPLNIPLMNLLDSLT